MAKRLSPKVIYALAEVITGGSAYSGEPPIGIYRSGPKIVRFFGELGYDVSLGNNSRLPFTEQTLIEIYRQPTGIAEITRIIEAAADPRDFIGQEDRLENVVSYLNGLLRHDGFQLEKLGSTYGVVPLEGSKVEDAEDRRKYEYDVALSYASEDRGYVEQVAGVLKRSEVRVFYDKYEEAAIWGKDLHEYLDAVFRQRARYCVIFISASYAEKVWTSEERRSAFARAVEDSSDYVLPARFDDTEIPGLRPTVAYIDLRRKTPEELAQLIETKLSGPT